MDAVILLDTLQAHGAEAVADGDYLRVRPASVLTDELRAEIREHKAELLVMLQAESTKTIAFTSSGLPTPGSIASAPSSFQTPSELSQTLQKYLPLVEAAGTNSLPPGPVVIAPGVTVTDPKLFVLSTWRELMHFAELTTTLHPTTKARLDGQCEFLDAVADWLDLEMWAQAHS
jgi:TubC N-terminal docking domain